MCVVMWDAHFLGPIHGHVSFKKYIVIWWKIIIEHGFKNGKHLNFFWKKIEFFFNSKKKRVGTFENWWNDWFHLILLYMYSLTWFNLTSFFSFHQKRYIFDWFDAWILKFEESRIDKWETNLVVSLFMKIWVNSFTLKTKNFT